MEQTRGKQKTSGKKPHQCLFCFTRFATPLQRDDHEKETHFNAKTKFFSIHETVREKNDLKCPRCPLGFTSQVYLKSHVEIVHEGKEELQCKICVKNNR